MVTSMEKSGNGREWKRPEGDTAKGYRWQCPACGRNCHYAASGKRDEPKKCLYKYCPWCGQEMTGSETKAQ